jgi:hypothetical protein
MVKDGERNMVALLPVIARSKATKQSSTLLRDQWIASLTLAMTAETALPHKKEAARRRLQFSSSILLKKNYGLLQSFAE